MKAPLPDNESDRLANLRLYDILDTLPEEEYDDLTHLASQVCGTPISLISLVDQERQWFKSSFGVDADTRETHRDQAFCAHNILEPDTTLVVPNTKLDERFVDNELVTGDPNIAFYAGVPLVTQEGYAIGSLCVIDTEPRELSAEQLDTLKRLARQVTRLLDLRLSLRRTEARYRERAEAYDHLREFSHVIAHDLKAPLRNIYQACEILEEEAGEGLSGDAREMMDMIMLRTKDANRMIRGVLRYSEATHVLHEETEEIVLDELIATVSRQLRPPGGYRIEYAGEVATVRTSRIALWQILQNLIGNAIKHHDKEDGVIQLRCRAAEHGHYFTVSDNGPGIPQDQIASIFNLFYTTDEHNHDESHGVGLSIVSRLVNALGGNLEVSSTEGEGTEFSFFLKS